MSILRGLACVLMLFVAMDARAQTSAAAVTAPPAPAPIDPSQPLPPLPNFGVAWPTAAAPPATPSEPAPAEDALVRYRSDVRGLDGTGAEAEFRALSALRNTKGPANLAQIEIRARADEALLDRLMRAHGFYGATIIHRTIPAAAAGGETTVTLTVTPGPRYTFASIEVTTPPGAPRDVIDRALALRPGAPVDAAQAIAARDAVLLALPNAGYPFASVAEPDIVIDHDHHVAHYSIAVTPGPQARFGALAVRGTPDLGEKHLLVIARFKPGQVYNQALVDDLRRALIATSLFASVQIRPERHIGPDGRLDADLRIAVTPAKPRTVAAQFGYDTIDGFRIETSWRHRNLINPEGAVTVRGVLATQEQSIGTDLNFSNWRKRDQSLDLAASISHLIQPAYVSNVLDLSATLQRKTTLIFQKPWTYSIGPELLVSSERERIVGGTNTQYFVIALPGMIAYDGSNDVLNPTRGFRLSARLSPEQSLEGSFTYVRAREDGSVYLPLVPRLVFAAREAVGAIVGAPLFAIPPTRRYYVGGGGSVCGYGYQEIGPKDATNTPTGGRSLTEFSAEFRYRATSTIGLVPFFDGGSLYQSEYPKFSGSYQYGAGLGARYFSAFGPIRFDIATPVNPRLGDPRVSIYVSIGQAF